MNIQETVELWFDASSPEPADFAESAWWFLLVGHRLMVQTADNGLQVPRTTHIETLGLPTHETDIHFLGRWRGRPCYAAGLPRTAELPDGWKAISLRRLFGQLDRRLLRIAGRAVFIIDWDRNNRFCGRCAAEMTADHDRAKVCPTCNYRAYPRLSPAVIMLVQRGDELLLARSHRHPEGFYSVLAGFAEPGETLEEAVAREVLEESGLQVKNVRYFGSQPWPFPDSLMIGFVCDYAGGEIVLHDDEIAEAGWYTADTLPGFTPPAEVSIAGQLIDWFKENHPAPSSTQD